MKAYLKRCSLPQATKALGMGSAAWLVKVYQWVMESDMFGSLTPATSDRGRRNTEGIYVGLCHKIGDFEFQDP